MKLGGKTVTKNNIKPLSSHFYRFNSLTEPLLPLTCIDTDGMLVESDPFFTL